MWCQWWSHSHVMSVVEPWSCDVGGGVIVM